MARQELFRIKDGKPRELLPGNLRKDPTPTPKLERADQEVKKQPTPEEALRTIKERGLFYSRVYENLAEEIENNNPDSEILEHAQLHLLNRVIGITETVDILTGRESRLPESQFEGFKWLGDIMQRYSQEKPEQK